MDDMKALLERLQAEQRELIDTAARAGGLPPASALRKIADLEVAIGAVEVVIESRAKRR